MNKSFEIINRVGISNESISDAVKNALIDAKNTGGVSWFEVIEQRGRVTDNDKIEFQVTLKIGRKLQS